MWFGSKDMNPLLKQFLWVERERQRGVKSLPGSRFIFQKVKLHPNELKKMEVYWKNVKVAKTSTQIRKSQIKFAHASLFQLPCVLIVKQSLVTQLGIIWLVGLGWFFVFYFYVPSPLPRNKTPASISAQDGRHTKDEGLYNEQAVYVLFAATFRRHAVRQQQLGKERDKHCLVFNATEHHFGELEHISATSNSTQNFVKQVFTDGRDTFYSFLDA